MTKTSNTIRIGTGAGFADDRFAPAVELAEKGELDYLVFECLAERTIARETLSRLRDEQRGYSPLLVPRLEAVLGPCMRQGTRIVANMGAANPLAAGREVIQTSKRLGLPEVRCAVLLGDDVSELIRANPQLPLMESNEPVDTLMARLVSANAYLGADAIARALDTGAQVVMTGRVADPSLFSGVALHHFGWQEDDLERMASATAMGHLLECCAQVSGGCFADPGRKDVDDLASLGFPFADIDAAGGLSISKLPGTGGRVDLATCKEQLLYEVHDPFTYLTPDCVLDITDVELHQLAKDRVGVTGAKARPKTDTYKVSVGYRDGYIGEGQVSYAGINAVARAKLAAEVVQERLKRSGHSYSEVRVDLIGISSLHGRTDRAAEPYEVRLRIAARTEDRRAAEAVGFETRTLHVNGPTGGGGGADPVVREVLAVQSVLIPKALVDAQVRIQEVH
ncbi:acyclic terpene utilization AtuA family protein [Ottowia thiooxydans]|uniref:Acyclic terpene utilisation N-terminal domain-containing protein n=1 Tax=Ottowia thiooxydans TaxID=219182 RepID=A0ABV2QCL0_9BURK